MFLNHSLFTSRTPCHVLDDRSADATRSDEKEYFTALENAVFTDVKASITASSMYRCFKQSPKEWFALKKYLNNTGLVKLQGWLPFENLLQALL